jgi:hypothetical protein
VVLPAPVPVARRRCPPNGSCLANQLVLLEDARFRAVRVCVCACVRVRVRAWGTRLVQLHTRRLKDARSVLALLALNELAYRRILDRLQLLRSVAYHPHPRMLRVLVASPVCVSCVSCVSCVCVCV